jgi:hypothetical protein
MTHTAGSLNGVVKSMGLVFGDIGKILKEADIDEKIIIYGMEDIITPCMWSGVSLRQSNASLLHSCSSTNCPPRRFMAL